MYLYYMNVKDIEDVSCKIENNQYILDIPFIKEKDLPNVSILTVTKDRKKFFNLLINNWKSIYYPKDKLEWVIIDEGEQNIQELIKPYLTKENNIKYKLLDKNIDIGIKRNMSVTMASHDILICMDDDDYYFPDSVLSKVRILKHSKKNCVISKKIAVLNLNNNLSYYINSTNIPEATLCFYRKFWEKYKFKFTSKGEGYHMVNNRYNEVISVMPFFNLIVLNHKDNNTGSMRDYNFENVPKNLTFLDFIDKNVQNIIKDLNV